MVRYLEEEATEPVQRIEYVVYDKDGDWTDVATDVAGGLETGIEIQIRYEEVDAASRGRMSQIDLSNVDLVIFSYVMSELAKLGRKDQISENFRTTLGTMKVNSKILFIDNLHPIFIKYFQSCKLVSGLNQQNDDGKIVICNLSEFEGTFKILSKALDWAPRTDLRSVSKLIVRTAK